MRKSFTFRALAMALCLGLTCSPASAQFKKLGKGLGKVAKDAGKAVTDAAGDMAEDMAANKVSDKVISFLDANNTVADANSEYAKRLDGIISNFATGESKTLNYGVYLSNEANVISLNNGSIRLYSGMMDILSDDDLKALIATQIGYIETGATRSNLMKAASGDNAADATASQLEKMLSMTGDNLGTIVNELLQVPYTTAQNTAAEDFAKKYLKSKKISTSILSDLDSKLSSFRAIDLDDEDLDDEDTNVIKAQMLSKFLNVTAQ